MFHVFAGDGEKGVEIHIPRSKSHDKFMSMRTKFAVMIHDVCCAIEKSLRLDDLKMFLKVYRIDGDAELDNCDSVQSVMMLITDRECSLTDITPLEAIVKRFRVTDAPYYIEEYKRSLEHFCESLSDSLCLKEKFEAVEISSLENKVTCFLDWKPDEKELRDITDILVKISNGKQVKIKYIDTN